MRISYLILGTVALAIPMNVAVESKTSAYPVGDIAGALEHAERLHSSGLEMFREHGTVTHLRGAATSLALIKIFQSSLGRSTKKAPAIVGNLLGMCHFTLFTCSSYLVRFFFFRYDYSRAVGNDPPQTTQCRSSARCLAVATWANGSATNKDIARRFEQLA